MVASRVERGLAAILAADVVGYSRLMERDERGTLEHLRTLRREVVEPLVAEHHGRIVKLTGDGVLCEFGSVVEAVACAVLLQRGMAEREGGVAEERRLQYRIGINLGDIVRDPDGDLYGDGVNVAARLEALAEPGGVCVSGTVFDHLAGKLDCDLEPLGEQALKNIARPVRVYRVALAPGAAPRPVPTLTLHLPDLPSIAVLPFQNMSGDPEQEYFADGMVEDLITALSRFRQLFVIARNSTFTYKGRTVDIRQVGRELGVRYVLEGSVRKFATRLRITAQLIEAATGVHIWADRYDGALEDVFELQDRVAESVVGAIAPRLERAEIERVKRKPTGSLGAYDHHLRGMAILNEGSRETNLEALGLFRRAIDLDREFAPAYAMAAYCYVWRRANGWMDDRDRETAESGRLARRAVELGRDDAVTLCWAGFALARVADDLEGGLAYIDCALSLNSNLAAAWNFSGRVRVYLGDHEPAIDHLARAMRLSPRDPLLFGMQGATAFAHFFLGRYNEACAWAEKAQRENSNFLPVLGITAASNALAGRIESARSAVERLCEINPTLRISGLSDHTPIRRPEDLGKYIDALRRAGLPD